jgi:cytochrome P450
LDEARHRRQLAEHQRPGECDFANAVTAAHPLRILSSVLGVPRSEEPRILRLTNQLFASDDEGCSARQDRQRAVKSSA